jgi:very-short-patch-repair endonuclease
MRVDDDRPPYHGTDYRGRPIYRVPEYIVALTRQLRRGSTTPEAALWECLRDRQLVGAKFRRQHAIERYVADFYCHEAALVIELDGAGHAAPAQLEYDALRDDELERQGLCVIRIRNADVLSDLGSVLRRIASLLSERLPDPEPSPPAPLPAGEGRNVNSTAGCLSRPTGQM